MIVRLAGPSVSSQLFAQGMSDGGLPILFHVASFIVNANHSVI
jgi:hypothetical protein